MKGHKAIYKQRGAENGFWHVACECGWHSQNRCMTLKRVARASHQRHIEAVRKAVENE